MAPTRKLVSEPIAPQAGTFATGEMASGLPGLPRVFEWRGRSYTVVERLEDWKRSSTEGGRADGDRYLRRHYFRLRMSDGSIWTVYFVRKTTGGRSPRHRWYLFETE